MTRPQQAEILVPPAPDPTQTTPLEQVAGSTSEWMTIGLLVLLTWGGFQLTRRPSTRG